MVLRYWGARDVTAEDFAAALDADGSGITVSSLLRLAEGRGYRALPFPGDPSVAAAHLQEGRPLIALAAAGPGRLHYVVLLAWANGRVLLHDPALGPFRVVLEADWLRRWSATGNATLLVLPNEPSGAAREELATAAPQCPRSSDPYREAAGLEFRRENWTGAAALAEEAVTRDPDDGLAWRLLATSRFLGGRREQALEAWNQVGEPKVDLVRIEGLVRTPFRPLYAYLGRSSGGLLTAESLRRTERRLAALPALQGSRVGYRPLGGGRARLEAAIVERPTMESPRFWLVESAVRGLTEEAVGLELANLTAAGDDLRLLGRWQPNRPRVAVAAAAPRALGLPGVVTVEGLWDEQSYRLALGPPQAGEGDPVRERWRHAAVSLDNWWTADLRAGISLAVDDWSGRGRHFSLAAELDRRFAGDRVSLGGRLAGWAPSSGGPGFAAATLRASARTRPAVKGAGVRFDLSYDAATAGAPLALWPGAGTGLGRSLLLRAHPLLRDGVIAGPAFGRRLVRAGLEAEAPLTSIGPIKLRGAAFVDAARVLSPEASPARTLVDVGAGLRVRLPWRGSALRVDLATPWGALRPRFSGGWQRQWPN
jgi:Peptidase C39 family